MNQIFPASTFLYYPQFTQCQRCCICHAIVIRKSNLLPVKLCCFESYCQATAKCRQVSVVTTLNYQLLPITLEAKRQNNKAFKSSLEQINIGFRYIYARLNSQWSQQAVYLEYLFLIVCHYTKLDIPVCDEAGRGRVHMSGLHIVQSHCPQDCLAPDLRNPNYMSAKTTYNTRPTRQLIT